MVTKRRKIRVAFCLRDMKVGGVESVLTRALDGLSKFSDIEIVVVTYTPIRDMWHDWFDKHKKISVRTLYPCKFLGTDLPHFFVARIIKHTLRDVYRFVRRAFFNKRVFRDIDIAVDYYDFDCRRELAGLKIPRVAWWHSGDEKFVRGGYVKYIGHYEKFVVLTDGFADALKSSYPDLADKVLRIYNPIDISNVRALSDSVSSQAGDYFVVVSRLVNGKDIKTVINAFDDFRQTNNNPNVRLVIVGDGYRMGDYKSFARGCTSNEYIDFMGAMKNPFGLMRGAKANILSSEHEGFALVLIEAAALGTLNIASDCHYGPREILMSGRAGLLFPVGDAGALSEKMSAVYNNTVDVKKMTACATRNLKRFDIQEISETVHDLLVGIKH